MSTHLRFRDNGMYFKTWSLILCTFNRDGSKNLHLCHDILQSLMWRLGEQVSADVLGERYKIQQHVDTNGHNHRE